ncbi:MAG: DUF5017 domain-containing protein [Mucilaginibacter sp.]|uniref:DUF5017 domain-containing protein n=1 Tax=Mucilaginibacter sp. TaxID=1882438 RepID=UPI003267A2C0
MKTIIPIRFITITVLVLACMACNKKTDVKPVDFDVTSTTLSGATSSKFALKDTVKFAFTGNPDIITFFSGEVGKRYEFATRANATGTPNLQFSSLRATGAQANSLQVLVSTDFKGVVANPVYGILTRDTIATNANIATATWTDITSRATLSTGATTAVASGVIDLSDLSQGKPVYIAFKYTATAGTIQNKWTISGLSVNNVLADGTTYTIANLNAPTTSFTNYGNVTFGPGWAVSYDLAKNANKYAWVYTDKTSLVITGSTTAASASAEAWAIMGPVDLTRVTPDAGVSLKVISSRLTSYQYNYAGAGTYNTVFVASNNTSDGASAIVKTIPVTITP